MPGDVVQDYIDYVKTSIINFFKILLKENYSKKEIMPIVEKYINVRYLKNTIIKNQDFVDVIIEEIVETATKMIDDGSDYVSQETGRGELVIDGNVIVGSESIIKAEHTTVNAGKVFNIKGNVTGDIYTEGSFPGGI